jgi:formylglycine-generating enzyme required for sulfatase activity
MLCLLAVIASLSTSCKPGDVVAGFTTDRTSGRAPLVIQFSDLSHMAKAEFISGWAWEFGDGQTSTAQNPSHTYTVAGVYSPRLTVTSSQGRTSVAEPATSITVLPGTPTELAVNLPGDVPLVLVSVPAGSFMMGAASGERGLIAIETPQHSVAVDSNFFIGKHEVTQQQWTALMGSWPRTPPNAANGLGDDFPVYNVTWDDARDFVTALNGHILASGQGSANMRLPSEAEWEYACRAGTTTRFFFGDSLDCNDSNDDCAAGLLPGLRSDFMWYLGNDSTVSTKITGTKQPNQFGLYDMSGNVFEWVEDDFHSGYTGAPASRLAWVDSPRSTYRVMRGGAFEQYAVNCRSAARASRFAGNWYTNAGFRVARDS